MKPSLALALLAAALVGRSAPAAPHGGGYTPHTPPKPTAPSGPAVPAPGPGAPAAPESPAPGPRPQGPRTPAPSAPSAGGGATPQSAPTTPATAALPDLSEWSWWWTFNRDAYLDLRPKVVAPHSLTGDNDFYLGRGQTTTAHDLAPDAHTKRTLVGPALRRAIETGTWRVRSDAMLALAKLHLDDAAEATSSLALIAAHLDAANQKEIESAVVALGLLGDGAALAPLAAVARDSTEGRELVGRASVPERTRALATLALGVLGHQLEGEYERLTLVRHLQALLAETSDASPELPVACVTALGLVPLAERPGGALEPSLEHALTDRGRQLGLLLALLADEERSFYVRAHVPKALAGLAADASPVLREQVELALLAELARRGRSERVVSYGVVEALGALGDADAGGVDARVRAALRDAVADGNNEQRGLALVALALVSSRPGQSDAPLAALADERAYLLAQLARGKSRLRPWAALALGLQSWHAAEAGAAPDAAVGAALVASFDEVRAPRDGGAWSLALGLCRDARGVPPLLARLERSADDDARGYAAVGLGLAGARDALPALQRTLAASRVRPALLRSTAIAMVLLGDKSVGSTLHDFVQDEATASVKTNCIAALGLVGDKRAVDPLVTWMEDEAQLDVTRAFCAIALGVTCEDESLPWTAWLMAHVNYFALTETLLTDQGTGILNLR